MHSANTRLGAPNSSASLSSIVWATRTQQLWRATLVLRRASPLRSYRAADLPRPRVARRVQAFDRHNATRAAWRPRCEPLAADVAPLLRSAPYRVRTPAP